jgi:hypothetical protein
MDSIKIPIHSTTDLITNSSTTIFTYSSGSEVAVVEMIDEVFESFGIHKKCKDVFDTVVLADSYTYSDAKEDFIPEGVDPDKISDIYEDVKSGKIEKPKWFEEIEDSEDTWSYYTPSTYLHLIPKKEEYKKLAKLISKFLYSTDHEATRDG